MPIFENGSVSIYYEEKGSGKPLLVIPGGGLNATIAGLANHAFNPLDEFSNKYRVISLDLRNANRAKQKDHLVSKEPGMNSQTISWISWTIWKSMSFS